MPEAKMWDGTAWVNLADEVAVAAAAPTDPAAELWLDTAAPDPTSALEERVAVLESMVATLMGDGS